MGSTAVIAAVWFAFWMIGGAVVGGLTAAKPEVVMTSIYYGIFNGAFIAALTSFAWPWIMPRVLDRWMSRGEAGEALD